MISRSTSAEKPKRPVGLGGFGPMRRMLTPPLFTTIYLLARYGSRISFRAEVELTVNLMMGRKVNVSSYCVLKTKDGPFVIGDRTTISSFACLASGQAGLRIGRDCLIGPNVTMVASNHVYTVTDTPINAQGFDSKGITIEDNVWIGAGTTVVDGAEIGSGSIVTPNTVVSGRFPPHSVISGNPAKIIFTRR